MHGWITLDKPEGLSSNYALNSIKRHFRPTKIGHAGTLDPFATGLLLVCVGEATKLQDFGMDGSKDYKFTITFGTSTDSYDLTGNAISSSPALPTLRELEKALAEFMGGYMQTPPIYSAIKVNGQRAYNLARSGQKVELAARLVKLDAINLVHFDSQTATITVTVGKGFYIRSLAADICHKLSVDGHVSMLRRTRIGNFTEEAMISLANLENLMHTASYGFLHPIDRVLDDILVRDVDEEQARCLCHGINIPNIIGATTSFVARYNGKLVAICEVNGLLVKPKRVFNL